MQEKNGKQKKNKKISLDENLSQQQKQLMEAIYNLPRLHASEEQHPEWFEKRERNISPDEKIISAREKSYFIINKNFLKPESKSLCGADAINTCFSGPLMDRKRGLTLISHADGEELANKIDSLILDNFHELPVQFDIPLFGGKLNATYTLREFYEESSEELSEQNKKDKINQLVPRQKSFCALIDE